MHKEENQDVKVESVSIDDAPTNENTDTNIDVEKLQSQLSEMNDKYLRMAAELENTRRRAALDAESRARNRAMSVAEKILPVMDAVEELLSCGAAPKAKAASLEDMLKQADAGFTETLLNLMPVMEILWFSEIIQAVY